MAEVEEWRNRFLLGAEGALRARINEGLATRIAALIQCHPTFGYRRLWAVLRFRDGQRITPKTVYRICALKGWFVHQRQPTPRPWVQGRTSQATRRDYSGGLIA